MAVGPIERMMLELRFARHMPIRRIARRLVLLAKWHWSAIVPPREPREMPRANPNPPAPLFPMRTGMIERTGASISLRFLNHVEPAGPPIDWAARDTGVAAQLWRMHLHYMEFLEEATAAEAEAWMLDWIDTNPPTSKGFWKDIWFPYSVSLRCVLWMQQLARHGADISSAARSTIERSVVLQISWLTNHLETDIGGNHLIKNAKALLWAAAYFEGKQADRWRERGVALLMRELPVQILADGFQYERSLSYHSQVFADLLEIYARAADEQLSARLHPVLERMAPILADLTHPDATPALFNDSGIDMAYAPGLCLDMWESLSGQRPSPSAVFAYRDAGYFGARDEQLYCVADCGAIGPDELPAHGHGDVFGFELSLLGRRLIVDQGVFEYTAGPRRQASRSAACHNTLCLDGADQAEFFSRFRVGRRPRVRLHGFTPSEDGFRLDGEHDGFAHLEGAPRHRRAFTLMRGSLRIEDHISGSSGRGARISFLLHPEVDAVTESDHRIRLTRDGASAVLTSTTRLEIEPARWWPNLGEDIESRRIAAHPSAAELADPVVSELHWGDDGRERG